MDRVLKHTLVARDHYPVLNCWFSSDKVVTCPVWNLKSVSEKLWKLWNFFSSSIYTFFLFLKFWPVWVAVSIINIFNIWAFCYFKCGTFQAHMIFNQVRGSPAVPDHRLKWFTSSCFTQTQICTWRLVLSVLMLESDVRADQWGIIPRSVSTEQRKRSAVSFEQEM